MALCIARLSSNRDGSVSYTCGQEGSISVTISETGFQALVCSQHVGEFISIDYSAIVKYLPYENRPVLTPEQHIAEPLADLDPVIRDAITESLSRLHRFINDRIREESY